MYVLCSTHFTPLQQVHQPSALYLLSFPRRSKKDAAVLRLMTRSALPRPCTFHCDLTPYFLALQLPPRHFHAGANLHLHHQFCRAARPSSQRSVLAALRVAARVQRRGGDCESLNESGRVSKERKIINHTLSLSMNEENCFTIIYETTLLELLSS